MPRKNLTHLTLALLLLALAACQAATPATPTALIPAPAPGATYAYTVHNSQDAVIAQSQAQVVGEEMLDGVKTWRVLTAIQNNAGPQQLISYTTWVEQASGVVIKSEYQVRYTQAQANTFNGQPVKIVLFTTTRSYDLQANTMDEKQVVIDLDAKAFESTSSGPADYNIFQLTRPVQKGEYYPWQTEAFPRQVVEQALIHVPAGSFNTWALKYVLSPENQYFLEYFDQLSGVLVRRENWAHRGDKWEKIEETRLSSFSAGQ